MLGKPVTPVPLDSEGLKKAFLGMGASADSADNFAELIAGFNAGHVTWESKGTRLVRGTTQAETVLAALAKQTVR